MRMNERNLIQNCINGDRKSQKQLYEFYASRMFAICLNYSKNLPDAEDVLQDGFIKLFNNLHKFRYDGSFDGWVRRIFVNTSIEHLRRKRFPASDLDGLENKIKDKHITSLDALYEKDLMKVTSRLSTGYKTVFHLYAVEGYSHAEIGKKLGIAESTSKSQYARAKAVLRQVIDKVE
jgi:RNA polymerase sigma factor (sigma-70 family)